MPRFSKELPEWTEKFKHPMTINPSEALALTEAVEGLGDKHLALLYSELPTWARTSILADELGRDIIERFLKEKLMIPALDPDLVPVV